MWYPTKLQWHVIWAATVVCMVAWLAGDPEPDAFVLPGALVGALFAWQVSAGFRQRKD